MNYYYIISFLQLMLFITALLLLDISHQYICIHNMKKKKTTLHLNMPQNAYINQAFLALGIDCLISQEKFCSLSHIIYPLLIIFYSAPSLRWLNTVLQAVSGRASFKFDKQTWRRKRQWYRGDDFSKSTH